MQLENTVALVTGAAAGLGKATALALAGCGADVIVADINGEGAQDVADEVQRNGRRACAFETDVGRRIDVESLVDQSIAWQGRCDVLISNAGVGCQGAPHAYTADDWQRLIDVNLMASVWATRSLLPHMLERRSGHLSYVSSGAGLEGFGDRAPYCVAKFGLVGLAESVARYLKETNVGASVVVPGAVSTSAWKSYVYADAERVGEDEIDQRREALRKVHESWPSPESMAARIVDGIRADRFWIWQEHPVEPRWFFELFESLARDPDAFVLQR